MKSGTSLERMVFFSDAVFAIALTLLALDLKLPEGIPAEQLDDALVAAWPQLLAYALSFVIIAKTWMSHHSDFALIRRFNANLAWLNLALLFFIAMLPAPDVDPQRLRGRPHPVAERPVRRQHCRGLSDAWRPSGATRSTPA